MFFLLVVLAFAPVFAQDADSNRLRALLKTVPQLPVERIDLKVKPPLMLEGISAVTSDKRGNILRCSSTGKRRSHRCSRSSGKLDPVVA